MKIRVYWMSMVLIAVITLVFSLRRSDAEASNAATAGGETATTGALVAAQARPASPVPAQVKNLRVTLNVEDTLVTQILNALLCC